MAFNNNINKMNQKTYKSYIEDNSLQGKIFVLNYPIQKMLYNNNRKLSALTDCSSKDSTPILKTLKNVTKTFGEAENIFMVSDFELEDEEEDEDDFNSEAELSFDSCEDD